MGLLIVVNLPHALQEAESGLEVVRFPQGSGCLQAQSRSWGLSLLPPLLYVNTTPTFTDTALATFHVAVRRGKV